MPTFEVETNGKRYEVEAPNAQAAADAFQPTPTKPPRYGTVLPVRRDEEGLSLDMSAGIPGSLYRTVMGPYDAMTGKLPPGAPETYARAAEAGAWMTPANAAGMLSRVPPKVPTGQELTRTGGKQIERAQNMGVDFDAGAVASWANSLRGGLERKVHPTRAKETYELLQSLESAPPGSVMEFRGLVAARQGFQDIAQSAKGQEKFAATLVIKEIDNLLGGSAQGNVLSGPAAAASRTYAEGRANYAAGKRSDAIGAREENADLQAAVANSGRNSGNRLRAQAKWFIDPLHPERLSGFSKKEIAALNEVARGTNLRNALRTIGNKLGGGGGIGGIVAGGGVGAGTGAFFGSPQLGALAGAITPSIGYGARAIDNTLTRRAFNKADEAVRSRSPLFSARQKNAPMTPISPQARAQIKAIPFKAAGAVPQLPRAPMSEEEWRAYVAAGGA